MTDAQPNLHRRRLGLQLRALRKKTGMNLNDASEKLLLSGPTALSRIENGKQRVPPVAVGQFFEVYGLVDETHREHIKQLAKLAATGKRLNTFDEYRHTIREPFDEYLQLEELAIKSETFAAVIPGLLQTRDYARAVVEGSQWWHNQREIDSFVELRMVRQQALHRDEPLRLWCILDECALYREVGGKDAMRQQLQHILKVTREFPNVTLQVLPFAHGAHAGVDGGFHLLHFPAGPPVAVVEQLTTAVYLEEDSDIGRYEMSFNHLRTEALDAKASRRHIQRVIKERYS